MNIVENINERIRKSETVSKSTGLKAIEKDALAVFSRMGIPTVKHEEWKYTRIGSLFNKEYYFNEGKEQLVQVPVEDIQLPGQEAVNELYFINGVYSSSRSTIRSSNLVVLPLEEAVESEYRGLVMSNLGCSARYAQDGIHALNTAFVHGGMFLHVKKGEKVQHPVHIYFINSAGPSNAFSQPRILVHIGEAAEVEFVENHTTLGSGESFTNSIVEVVVEKDALVEYYKLQNDRAEASQVSNTHFRQVGKSTVHVVTVSLNGNIVRNNLSITMEAERSESHLYGLYFLKGASHVDNHTVVDHVKPHCQSNEYYKGIMDDHSTAVFNGKIFVRQQAQKTNAYQSNKNVLLAEGATVNTKPQLEIFADDVKCSHGCTVGRLDEEGLFYLKSRGISEKMARSLLVQAFVIDILEKIKPEGLRRYVEQLISERLEIELS